VQPNWVRPCGALLLLASLGCDRLVLPEGPELAELHAAYDDPRGTVDEATIANVAALAVRDLDAILGLGRLDFVTESLTEVSEVVKDSAQGEADSRFRLKAVASVDHVCPGDGSANGAGGEGGAASDENGILTYTMRVRENGILDTVWGEFSDCRFADPGEMFPGVSVLPRTPGSIVTYDGSMDVYLGGDLALARLSFQSFLFRLRGTLTLAEGLEVNADLDFRIHRDHTTEVRAPGEEGDVVFTFRPGTTLAGLLTGDGSFCCALSERICVLTEQGDKCEALPTGGDELRW
jgi:hypothetical protein